MNVTLNVSGQHFEVNKSTLWKIPYFHDMINDCGIEKDNVIFVNRSSHVFKHVLALIIDPLYPYPSKYSYELDVYGVVYDKNKLLDNYRELINKLDIMISNNGYTMDKILELEKYHNKSKTQTQSSQLYKCPHTEPKSTQKPKPW